MAKTETRVKVVFTKAGEAYSATQAYRLHDYIVLNGVTIYACKKVDPATMTCVGHPLTDTAYWDKFMDIADFKAAAEKATASANAAAKSATDAAGAANTAKTNADRATEAANTAASAANTAKTNADTATGKANAAAASAEKVDATITAENVLEVTDRNGVKKTLSLVSQVKADEMAKQVEKNTGDINAISKRLDLFGDAFVGFARVSGDADPKPSETFVYGNRQLVREIGKHIKIGTVKRVGNQAVLQHECAKGRITLATNGDTVAVDGTEGDLLVYTDIPLYLLKANEIVGSNEMSCLGVGVVPCYWQNHAAKRLDCFGISPFYTTNCKLEGDERSQAHCVITDKAVGTYTAPNGFFKEVFKASGANYPSQYVSALQSIHQAQNKNADPNTNFPYMGCYYEFYELMLAMMYAECGTRNTTDLYSTGVGCTMQEVADDGTWNNAQIAANSGFKYFAADGSATFGGIMRQNLKQGASGKAEYAIDACVGDCHYGFTQNGEVLSLFDGITKAGLQASVGSAANIFYYDENNNVVCSSDGSINLTTGEGMVANKRYYVVRNVPNCEGIAEGVMTAVANCYVKMNVADNIFVGTTDLTGGYAILKLSHSIYRGMSIPLDGLFRQLSGAYYVSGQTASGYYDNFYCADKWQDVAPLTNDTGYGDIGTEFNLLKGLSKEISVSGNNGWVSKADYSQSFFCFKAFGANPHIHEVVYTWNDHFIWGYGVNGRPELGKEGVKALAVGCVAFHGAASACTAACFNGVGNGNDTYAGAFAVPQLIITQTRQPKQKAVGR